LQTEFTITHIRPIEQHEDHAPRRCTHNSTPRPYCVRLALCLGTHTFETATARTVQTPPWLLPRAATLHSAMHTPNLRSTGRSGRARRPNMSSNGKHRQPNPRLLKGEKRKHNARALQASCLVVQRPLLRTGAISPSPDSPQPTRRDSDAAEHMVGEGPYAPRSACTR